MHTFFLRVIGKAQTNWQAEAIEEYKTRLAPYAKVQIIECAEGHQGSAKPDEAKTRLREAESLLASLPANAFLIALDEQGKNLSSSLLANTIKEYTDRPIVFFIGGSWGLDASIRNKVHLVLSLGKQTLPHLLARIVLLEQLYRVETILQGKTYHK
jgi:23S rRNA (pseudouridine1915-N3)-methyltransferase